MLEMLNKIPWHELKTAEGDSADSVPEWITELASEDSNQWVPALETLTEVLQYTGTSVATTAAVPFLIELAGNPQVPARAMILELLARIAIMHGECFIPGAAPVGMASDLKEVL